MAPGANKGGNKKANKASTRSRSPRSHASAEAGSDRPAHADDWGIPDLDVASGPVAGGSAGSAGPTPPAPPAAAPPPTAAELVAQAVDTDMNGDGSPSFSVSLRLSVILSFCVCFGHTACTNLRQLGL